jgi:hypothetical protein
MKEGQTLGPRRRRPPHELHLTRRLLLEHSPEGRKMPEQVLRYTRNHSCITHWEELVCVAINTKLSRLMAVACIHQPDGYSSVINDHDSSEYVRFFIDWGRGEGYESLGVADFEVRDVPKEHEGRYLPYHQLVTARFNEDRYWDSVLDGIQPKACAVLSWHQQPPEHTTFRPVFGNVIESRICTESFKEIMALYEHPPM